MPNPSVSFRVEAKDLTAWQRVVALLRQISPEEAERRLQGESVPAAETRSQRKADKPDAGGVQFLESRVLAALGRWRLPMQTKARSLLTRHGLPDTAENRCSALVAAVEEETGQRRREWDDLRREAREAQRSVAALSAAEAETRRRLHSLRGDISAYEAQAHSLKVDLDAARAKAKADYDAEHGRELQRLRASGYAPADIRAVIDAVRKNFSGTGAVADLLGAVESVGTAARLEAALRADARAWERYLGFLREEARREAERLPSQRVEMAELSTRAGLEPQQVRHRTIAEVLGELERLGVDRTRSAK